ncbi:tryptophan--tRNA ligase [Candidatus Cyanaurora vandensis]|uniref:tryptophan--tRNA ligase n=1 Tax=Candidatus Cyanaurora vandensis TaxID=2714958 RepID=UPI00257F7D7A|nr:tryptophan--tRNA ligase [Candidatus Cyanaurora vandensis]
MTNAKLRTFSGIQPTGQLHLGNYLGAIRNWVQTQAKYDNYFCVVDLHAITAPHDPAELRAATRAVAALYLACGVDLDYATVFVQSHVPAHSQLAWLLMTQTPLNWLESMTQYKEKSLRQGENVGAGLLNYPALMAADILLYQPHGVPVGADQKEHIEVTRDLARRFNDRYGPTFRLPEPWIQPEGARVMSLTDGTKKMSKSDPSDLSRISLLDTPKEIEKKIKRAKTDPQLGLSLDLDRPESTNLLTIYALLTHQEPSQVAAEFATSGYGPFKARLSEAAINFLAPMQTRYRELTQEVGYLETVLKTGAERARVVAHQTLTIASHNLGLLPPT